MDYLRDSQSKSRCDAFDFAPYGGKSKKGGVQNACYPPQAGADLRQQLQPFAADFRFERGKASDVSAGMRKTLNQTGAYRVDNDYEYDWDAASCPLQRSRCQCAVGHDHVRRQGHELRGVSAPDQGLRRPSDSRSEYCVPLSNPASEGPAEEPRRGPVLPDRSRHLRSTRQSAAPAPLAARAPRAAKPPLRRRATRGTRGALSRSFPRKRQSRGHGPRLWVPAFAGTNGVRERGASFDHLVGAGKQHWRHVKRECSRGFEIDDQLERRRLENR